MMRRFVLLAVLAASGATLLVSSADVQAPTHHQVEQAVRGVATRFLGKERADELHLALQPELADNANTWRYERCSSSDSCRVRITATSGVALARGVYSYARDLCGAHRSWFGSDTRRCREAPLPLPPTHPVQQSSLFPLRFYQNVCTLSYTMVWWDWPRWEAELDWMALHGINAPLAFVGQEAVWVRVFQELGISASQLADFFAGPAFLAWYRMGNLQGWGGPLPMQWIEQQVQLQRQILKRMRELGMTPVMPAFAGHVPTAFVKRFPHVKVSRSSTWNGFQAPYGSVWSIEPDDAMFAPIGTMFLEVQKQLYGQLLGEHLYSADMYNEMRPRSSDPQYLAASAAVVLAGMRGADPAARWVMQTWTFSWDRWWWMHADRIEAYLSGVPPSSLVLLDLSADLEDPPTWQWTAFFNHRPVVWGMVHNFGGNHGLGGRMWRYAGGPWDALHATNSTLIGTAIVPEGLEQNPVVYALATDAAWGSEQPNLHAWLRDYTQRRYVMTGESPLVNKAWTLLLRSVYDNKRRSADRCLHRQLSSLADRPFLYTGSAKDHYPAHTCSIWYDTRDVWDAWSMLQKAASQGHVAMDAPGFRYDVVDAGRQALSDVSLSFHQRITTYYQHRDVAKLSECAGAFMALMSDLERLLRTNEGFDRLGHWLRAARSKAGNDTKLADLYEWNARNQLTLWGPTGNIHDYANKHWPGLIGRFSQRRWGLYLARLLEAAVNDTDIDYPRFKADCVKLEERWTLESIAGAAAGAADAPHAEREDAVLVAAELYSKYRPVAAEVYGWSE